MPYGLDTYDYDPERDLKKYKLWVCDKAHSMPPWCPLYTDIWYSTIPYGLQYGAEICYVPTTKGWDWRIKDGYGYITGTETTEEERKQREPLWREATAKIVDDPWGYWDRLKAELMQRYERLRPFDVEKADNRELNVHLFDDLMPLWRRMWEIHFDGMYAFLQGHIVFREICRELTGIKHTDIEFTKLMSGFDNALFRLNKGLAELGSRAIDLGVADTISTLSDEEVIPKMEQSYAGKQWLKGFDEFLSIHGWRAVRMLEVNTPTWLEKPSMVMSDIRRMIAIGGGYAPELKREALSVEREELKKEVLAKVPADQREWFGKLMTCAQVSHFYSEDHDVYCEFYCTGLIRRCLMEFAKRFVKAGIIDDPQDIFYLLAYEINFASIMQERIDMHPVIEKRKEEYNGYLGIEPEMFLGDPSKLGDIMAADPMLNTAIAPRVAEPEEVGATCVGAASAPGVAEGIARVIRSEEELNKVQPGEILVTPFTSATWTPVFGIIKAVVTDSGGALAHAAIVGREYGIPAVVGTLDATKKIKTGDKIRVDGDLLRVYVIG